MVARSTNPDITAILNTWLYGRFTKSIQSKLRRNFIGIFLEADLAIEIIQEPQSDLEEKVNPSILKDYFLSRRDLRIDP